MNYELIQRHCEERSNLSQYDYRIEIASQSLAMTGTLFLISWTVN